ncbi:unnamed protein product [Adineta ricciae]|uniref:Hexosyltransferase n=1 Tax=Adineta ricciae TaxID=249248 RepID=A0A813QLR5_ADIRI|nr:unnamed protein product [Adineta ricciae]CAF1065885.1 unnamed protein product [Adineta ricciae]
MDEFIVYNCTFQFVSNVYLRLTSWSCRHTYRCLGIGYMLLLILILFFNFHIYEWQLNNAFDDRIDEPTYCNRSIIRKHFIRDQSIAELLPQKSAEFSFSYELSNNNICSSTTPHAIIFVISKSSNFPSRLAIRRTWGDLSRLISIERFAQLRLKLLFLLDIDEARMLSIKLEQAIYNDLIQVRLPEHYTLSTYRDMAILHWTETYCSQVLLTIKTDDDIFLNTFLLANVLTHIISNATSSSALIYGIRFRHARVVRYVDDLTSESVRYITTHDEYPCAYYPDYMSGFGYIITRNARLKLLSAFARHQKLISMSDVYITGILAEYMNIPRQHLRFQISYLSNDDCEVFFNADNAYACASSSHYVSKQAPTSINVDIFERFNTYWKRVIRNRFLYINKKRF